LGDFPCLEKDLKKKQLRDIQKLIEEEITVDPNEKTLSNYWEISMSVGG